jgi:hypothetical protein
LDFRFWIFDLKSSVQIQILNSSLYCEKSYSSHFALLSHVNPNPFIFSNDEVVGRTRVRPWDVIHAALVVGLSNIKSPKTLDF